MTIDWDKFSAGDEVAVTFVGKIEKYGDSSSLLRFDNGWGISGCGADTQLGAAVDAYRIEPDYKPGDMVRLRNDTIWQRLGEGWRMVSNATGGPGQCLTFVDRLSDVAVSVKVVDA